MVKIKNKSKLWLLLGMVIFVLGVSYQLGFSKMFDDAYFRSGDDSLQILVGDLDTVWAKELTRVAVANPSVADVIESKSDEILVSGKAPGKTDIYIWDKYGKRKVTVWVFAENLDLVEARIKELLKSADITNVSIARNDLEGKLIVSGDVEEKEKKTFDELVSPFASSMVNLVKERQKKELIEFDVQFSEVSASYSKNLGIEWSNADGGGEYIYTETLPSGNIKDFGNIFKIGSMARATAIQAKISALITEGKGKVLSRPKIVVKSGEEASFSVGGQIPVKSTTTSSGGNVTEDVTFHDYGVQLTVKSTVEKDGKIDVDLNIDITDIDSQNKVGDDVGYTKRAAKTKLYLDSGQTIILAGFIKDNKSETIKRIPLLGSLPFVGGFFRSKSIDPDNQTELFISLKPTILTTNEEPKKEAEAVQDVKASESPVSISAAQAPIVETPKIDYPSVVLPETMAKYARSIQEYIAKNVLYPDKAKASKTQGLVEINVSLINSGALVEASVNKSSGSKELDEAALETVQRLSPYRAFPSDVTLKQLTVTIPIVYQLN